MNNKHLQKSLFSSSSHWVYEKNADNTERYLLGINGNKPLMCMGVNPSTATPGDLDNTVKSVVRFARVLGHDSWLMLNLYPQRATNPNDLHKTVSQDAHTNNLAHIENVLLQIPNPTIWAAWGTLIEKRSYLLNCLTDIQRISAQYDARWFCIGNRSKKGHPHHPLYLATNSSTSLFEIDTYIGEFPKL